MDFELSDTMVIYSIKELERIKMKLCMNPSKIQMDEIAWIISLCENLLGEKLKLTKEYPSEFSFAKTKDLSTNGDEA
mgnify:FL=1